VAQGYYNIRKNLPVLDRHAHDQSHGEFRSARKMLDEQLRQMQSALDLADIMLVNSSGRVVYSSNPHRQEKDFSHPLPEPLQQAFSEGKNNVYLSDIFVNKVLSEQPGILITAPARDIEGTFIGVIAFEADLRSLYPLIQDVTGLGNTGEVLLGKKTGNEVVFLNPLRHDPEAAFRKTVGIGGELGGPVQEATQGKEGAGRLIDYRGEKVIAAWRYIPSLNVGMVAKIDADEAFADIINLRRLVIIILAIVFVLSGIVAFSIAQSISQPIRTLTKGAEIIGSGNLDHQVGTGLKDEIGQLSRAFDRMTRNLKKVTASRDELNREITERKRTEEAIRAHKEWLDLAQRSARVAPFEWNIQTDRAIWSREMEALYGLGPGEFDGTFEGWARLIHPDDREAAMEAVTRSVETGGEFDHEFRVVWPDGKVRWLHGRCTVTRDNDGRPHRMIGIVSDITRRKRAEILEEARLRILTEANTITSSSDEIMTVALDEIESLTGSAIGFYHFMEADQETLSLQSWSTNTLRNMCTAEGKGRHYPVSRAGVWAECVYQRRPVIHNDYVSLPNRKGLPPGHAPVMRELVVPIMRGGGIVAIIGVGNKPTDYDETDAQTVSYMGDLSWEMVERKRAEETLIESEHRL
jgi:PAS domain S-box-containing protein